MTLSIHPSAKRGAAYIMSANRPFIVRSQFLYLCQTMWEPPGRWTEACRRPVRLANIPQHARTPARRLAASELDRAATALFMHNSAVSYNLNKSFIYHTYDIYINICQLPDTSRLGGQLLSVPPWPPVHLVQTPISYMVTRISCQSLRLCRYRQNIGSCIL